jgi:S-adenosylmethionine-diacylgycerolhomoserine-N-methlytransferase
MSAPSESKPPASSSPVPPGSSEQALAMDKMYHVTRHIYDLTRAYYLLGRDKMLGTISTAPHTATIEVGCGTARNLIKLARRPAPGLLYGLDASHEMLETAASSIQRSGVGVGERSPIVLRQGLAEDLDGQKMFGRTEPFDNVFFSYCLSMVPTWPGALEAAMDNLKVGGTLVIVDFWDQQELPKWFAAILKKWLSLFHVHYRPEVHAAITALEKTGAEVTFESVFKRYAYIAKVIKR